MYVHWEINQLSRLASETLTRIDLEAKKVINIYCFNKSRCLCDKFTNCAYRNTIFLRRGVVEKNLINKTATLNGENQLAVEQYSLLVQFES